MLAHSPEACKNATSFNKKELPEKQWNRKEDTFLALTCDVPVFHMPCAALGTISSGMGWNWKSCREGDSLSGGTEQFLYKQRLSAPKLFALGEKGVSQCTYYYEQQRCKKVYKIMNDPERKLSSPVATTQEVGGTRKLPGC